MHGTWRNLSNAGLMLLATLIAWSARFTFLLTHTQHTKNTNQRWSMVFCLCYFSKVENLKKIIPRLFSTVKMFLIFKLNFLCFSLINIPNYTIYHIRILRIQNSWFFLHILFLVLVLIISEKITFSFFFWTLSTMIYLIGFFMLF